VNFLNPWFAAAVATVVVPALLILYFLKLRRREEWVASTLLWKRAVQDLQVNAPFQRLRKNLLLFLQLLILAAAVLALARPIVQSRAADAERVVLLIDRSASMNTREGDKTRLDLAKEQAGRLVRTFNRRTSGWRSFFSLSGATAQSQVMVIAFGDHAAIVSPFTTNTAELVDLINAIKPTDTRTDMREALDLAQAYMSPPSRTTDKTPESTEIPAKLVLISDGKVNLDQLTLRSGTLELLRVGEARDNVGITTLRAQRNYERPESVNVFLTVENAGPDPVSTDVSLYVDGVLRTAVTVELAARPKSVAAGTQPVEPADEQGSYKRSISFPPPGRGDLLLDRGAVIEARLSRDDLLATDNSATLVVPPPRRQRVLVVTEGKYPFLDSVMRGLPLQEYPFVKPEQYEAGEGGPLVAEGRPTYDVVIFDEYAPDQPPPGNYIYFGALPKVDAIKAGEKVTKHAVIWWDEVHPLMRHVSMDYVYIAESTAVTLPPQAEVLAEGPRGPLIFRYAADGRQYLTLTFGIENSTWWSKLSFAVFMYNAIRYLGGGDAEAEAGAAHAGDTLRIPVRPEKTARVMRPDGAEVRLTPDAGGTAYYGGTERVGLYRVEGGVTDRDRYAVNLEDEWETDIAPPEGPLKLAGDVKVGEVGQIKASTPEVWRWFIGAALAVLLLEWYIYNRRVML
jgi:hypothetical protein